MKKIKGALKRRAGAALVAALALFSRVPAHAELIIPSQLESAATSIKEMVTGPFIVIVITIILAGCGIAYAYNKDNEKVKAKIIAVAIGAVIIAAAADVAGMLLGDK